MIDRQHSMSQMGERGSECVRCGQHLVLLACRGRGAFCSTFPFLIGLLSLLIGLLSLLIGLTRQHLPLGALRGDNIATTNDKMPSLCALNSIILTALMCTALTQSSSMVPQSDRPCPLEKHVCAPKAAHIPFIPR